MKESNAKIYHKGKWVDPMELVIIHHLLIDKNGCYEMKIQIGEKFVVMRSCENCNKGEE